jgi:hypothetical protein
MNPQEFKKVAKVGMRVKMKNYSCSALEDGNIGTVTIVDTTMFSINDCKHDWEDLEYADIEILSSPLRQPSFDDMQVGDELWNKGETVRCVILEVGASGKIFTRSDWSYEIDWETKAYGPYHVEEAKHDGWHFKTVEPEKPKSKADKFVEWFWPMYQTGQAVFIKTPNEVKQKLIELFGE